MTKRKEPENLDADPVDLPAVQSPSNGAVPSLLFAPIGGNTYTSYDINTELGRNQAYLAKEDESTPLVSMENKEISIQHVLCHDAHTVDKESGEIIPLVRIVLVDDTGKQYDTVSTGVRACLGTLAIKRGLPPWNPALKVRITKSGRMLRLSTVT